MPGAKPGEYLPIRRRWSPGDVVHLQAEMTPQVFEANPRLADDTGRVAVQRGPLVYCLEALDQTDGVSLSDVALNVGKRPESDFQTDYKADLLGGVVVLHTTGVARDNASNRNALYSRYTGETVKTRPVPLTFIPYYAWSNREPTPMQVWTPLLRA